MARIIKFLNKYPLILIFLISVPAVWHILYPGFWGASDDLHIGWLHEMDRVVREGQFPPRFVPDLSYQFGYPLFNFVFPLPFYIAEVFHLFGFTLVASIKTLFLLTIPLSGWAMYRLVAEYRGRWIGIAAAAIYMYTPYRSTDIYVRGAIGEIVAFVFLPLALLSVVKIYNNAGQGRRWVGILALSIAAIITSHNIIAYMFLPVLAFLAILYIFFGKPTSRLSLFAKYFFGIFLGFLVSVYFWLPAVVESGLMQEDFVFNFIDHFPTLRQLVTPYFGWGASVPGPYDGMSFFIGLINLGLVICAFLALIIWRKKIGRSEKIITYWALIVFAISVFFMNYRSTPLWEYLPLIKYFQFPWRFLSLTTLVTPILLISVSRIWNSNKLTLVLIILALLLNFSYFKPFEHLDRGDEYYINRYIPEPHASQAYQETGEEYLRLSKETGERPGALYPRVSVKRGEITELILTNSLDAEFQIKNEVLAVVSYNKYLFPGWRAIVDGEEAVLHPGRPFGQIYLNLLPGDHRIRVFYRETKERLVLDFISLIALSFTLTIVVKPKHAKDA